MRVWWPTADTFFLPAHYVPRPPMFEPQMVLELAALGLGAGLLAGMLGIGGGFR